MGIVLSRIVSKDDVQANSSSRYRAKSDREKVKKFRASPDVLKMKGIQVKALRATFYPESKEAFKRKITQLEKNGFEYVILIPKK